MFGECVCAEDAADTDSDIRCKRDSRNRFRPLCGIEKNNKLVQRVIRYIRQPMMMFYQPLYRVYQPVRDAYSLVACATVTGFSGTLSTFAGLLLARPVLFSFKLLKIPFSMGGKLRVKK